MSWAQLSTAACRRLRRQHTLAPGSRLEPGTSHALSTDRHATKELIPLLKYPFAGSSFKAKAAKGARCIPATICTVSAGLGDAWLLAFNLAHGFVQQLHAVTELMIHGRQDS